MKSKGFTLIELLAVIVILAVISLIITPVVLDTIDDSKKASQNSSKEIYLRAVDQAIAAYNVNNPGRLYSPEVCMVESDGNLLCDGKVQLKVEANGENPQKGAIIYSDGVVVDNTISFDKPESKFEETCALISDSDKSNSITLGDKYLCKVKKELEDGEDIGYYFYVLSFNDADGNVIVDDDAKAINSQDAKSVNLIMDQNINSDGTKAGLTKIKYKYDLTVYNTFYWSEKFRFNSNGPISAMNYLYEATKDWNNIPLITFSYDDIELDEDDSGGYSLIVNNGEIADEDDLYEVGTSLKPLRARLPIHSPNYIVEVDSKTANNKYLYDNLLYSSDYSTVNSYWTLSSCLGDFESVYFISIEYNEPMCSYADLRDGMRPVITLGI